MKRVILYFALILLFIACDAKQDKIRIENPNENTISISFTTTKKYLLLPIEDTGREIRMDISVNKQQVNFFIVRLAENKIDYWMPLDISEWQNKEIKIDLKDFLSSAISLKEMKLSDTFDMDYAEKYRPGYHFSPLYGWMNDPNGMVYYDGEYHLFYQHNPLGTRWQNMSWGHAVSTDLIHWEHLSEGLFPDSLGTIFSGSAVVDENNTAGLQTGNEKTLLAYFTHSERQGQFQSLAYSNDRGRSWTKYENNPILRHETARDFRDPKVFWHEETQSWVMILAVGQVMEIYSSRNAIEWQYESNFGEGYGAHDGVWECPDLFELQVDNSNERKWVLICNINPGGLFGGSATQYFIGAFDGKTFTCENDPQEVNWMDWGKDHYAAVTWSDTPGRRVAIAWMSNWEYANDVPTIQFRSSNSVPRDLRLVRNDGKILLCSNPVAEIVRLRENEQIFTNIQIKDEYSIDNFIENNQGMYEILLTLKCNTAGLFGFKLFNSKGEYTDIYLSRAEKKLYVDRKNSGIIDFSEHFPAITWGQVGNKEEYRIRLLVDKASIEIFEGEGEMAMTNLIFPSEPYNRISLYAKGGECEVEEMTIYELKINK